jgi:hypothetical protein
MPFEEHEARSGIVLAANRHLLARQLTSGARQALGPFGPVQNRCARAVDLELTLYGRCRPTG